MTAAVAQRRSARWRSRFLEHLARSGDIKAAAAAAGVGRTTIYRHRDADEGFAAAMEAAVDAALGAAAAAPDESSRPSGESTPTTPWLTTLNSHAMADAAPRPVPAAQKTAAAIFDEPPLGGRGRGRRGPYYVVPGFGEMARPNDLLGRIRARPAIVHPGQEFVGTCPDCRCGVPEDRYEDHRIGLDSECLICPRQNRAAINRLLETGRPW